MSLQPDSASEAGRRGSAPGPDASLDDAIDTREAFDAEVQALAARALRKGEYPRVIEAPITAVEQITDELLDLVASGTPARDNGEPAFMIEMWVLRRSGRSRPSRRALELEAQKRRAELRETLTKLVHMGVDVAPVVNVLDAGRWQYAMQYALRGQKRLAGKLKRLKARVDSVLQDLISYHRSADRLIRKVRGPGTLEEFMAGTTERLYPEAEPALGYRVAHAALLRDGRLDPSFLPRRGRGNPHQRLNTDVARQLRRLGVGAHDAANLIRAAGLLHLTRTDRRSSRP